MLHHNYSMCLTSHCELLISFSPDLGEERNKHWCDSQMCWASWQGRVRDRSHLTGSHLIPNWEGYYHYDGTTPGHQLHRYVKTTPLTTSASAKWLTADATAAQNADCGIISLPGNRKLQIYFWSMPSVGKETLKMSLCTVMETLWKTADCSLLVVSELRCVSEGVHIKSKDGIGDWHADWLSVSSDPAAVIWSVCFPAKLRFIPQLTTVLAKSCKILLYTNIKTRTL